MISVLTLVKNRAAHLQNLVEGLKHSTSAPFELIIVDMSDKAVERPVADFPVTLIRHPTDGLPLAEARNLAANKAGSEFLLFLDVDCIPGANLVSTMANALYRRDALICAEIRYLTAKDTTSGPWSDASLNAAGMPHPARRFPPSGIIREADFGLFWSLAFGISASAFAALDGFDERFSGYGAEDTDFAFSAREAGLELLFLGGTSAYHQHHGVFDPPLQHFADIVRNACVFHDKWNSWPMIGWLDAFAELGLIDLSDTEITVIRAPTDFELRRAAQPENRRF